MEKYGADLNTLPPTEEQIRLLIDMCQRKKIKFIQPATREEAEKLLWHLMED